MTKHIQYNQEANLSFIFRKKNKKLVVQSKNKEAKKKLSFFRLNIVCLLHIFVAFHKMSQQMRINEFFPTSGNMNSNQDDFSSENNQADVDDSSKRSSLRELLFVLFLYQYIQCNRLKSVVTMANNYR